MSELDEVFGGSCYCCFFGCFLCCSNVCCVFEVVVFWVVFFVDVFVGKDLYIVKGDF